MKKISVGKLLLTLLMIMIVVVTGTYAWFSYQSKKAALVLTIGDLNDSQVIITPYEIRDTMLPVFNYSDGVYSQITVINDNDSKMTMKLYYKINELPQTLAQSGLKYTIVNSESKNGEYTEVYSGDFSTYSDSLEIDLYNTSINSNTTTYYRLYLWLDSNYGNQTILENTNLDVELNASIARSANAPVLDSGMIPVTISNDGTVTTVSEDDDSWYDYNNQEWANVVLVTESSRSNYLDTSNTVVQESDILAYYVWIPRFKYKIWTTSVSSTGNEQEIGIIFESSITPKSNGTKVGEYLTHPAFTFGNQELEGFWVGKFETTGTADNPTVLPNTTSLRSQDVSTQFATSLKFAGGTLSNGNVTFSGSSKYGLTTNINSHMMKNSEWGAVAYLSHSKYGINEEIYINNSSGYYTGRSGGSVGGSATAVTYGSYSWLGQAVSTSNVLGEITDTTLGTKASTTGNVTGIYDMSGGAYDRVMGNYSNTAGSSGYTIFPPSKYYDLYLSSLFIGNYSTNNNYCTLDTCGGHALYETTGWYSNGSYFVYSEGPWFKRGGYNNNGKSAGAFSSTYSSGGSNIYSSWRSVLAPVYEIYITISYNSNGGTGTMEDTTYIYESGNITLPNNTFAKSGYTFTGWHIYNPKTSMWYGCTDDSIDCTISAGNSTIGWYSEDEIKLYYQPQSGSELSTTISDNDLVFYAQWKQSLTYLYYYGDVNESLTGGYYASKSLNTNQAATQSGSVTFNTDNMVAKVNGVTGSKQAGGLILTTNQIDVSNYKTLYYRVSYYTSSSSVVTKIGLFNTAAIPVISAASVKQISSTTDEALYSIDISSLTGSYYFGFYLGWLNSTATAYVTVKEAYLSQNYEAPICTISATAGSTTLTAKYSDSSGVTGYYFGKTIPTSSTTFTSMTSSTSGTISGTVSETGTYYFGFINGYNEVGYCSGTSSALEYTTYCPNLGTPPSCYYNQAVPKASGSCTCESNSNSNIIIDGSCVLSGTSPICSCTSGFSQFANGCSMYYILNPVYENSTTGYGCPSGVKLSDNFCWK